MGLPTELEPMRLRSLGIVLIAFLIRSPIPPPHPSKTAPFLNWSGLRLVRDYGSQTRKSPQFRLILAILSGAGLNARPKWFPETAFTTNARG